MYQNLRLRIYYIYTISRKGDTMETEDKMINSKGVFNVSTTAQKWGNSIGVRIPRVIAKQYQVEHGSRIEVRANDEGILLRPVKDKPKLDDLLAQITEHNQHKEVDWGRAEGDEIW